MSDPVQRLGDALVALVDQTINDGVPLHDIAMRLTGFGIGSLVASGFPADTVRGICDEQIRQAEVETSARIEKKPPPS